MHLVEDVGISPWPVEVIEFSVDAYAHRKQVDVKQLYNQVPQTVWVSWVRVAVPVGDKMPEWEPAPDRGLGPSGPTVEQPSRMRKKCCYGQRNLGSICCSLFRLQLTSHTQPLLKPFCNPFENKVWEVYFSKEVCSFVIIIDYVSACICIWLYNTQLRCYLLYFFVPVILLGSILWYASLECNSMGWGPSIMAQQNIQECNKVCKECTMNNEKMHVTLSFYKVGFRIKYLKKVDWPSNKEAGF